MPNYAYFAACCDTARDPVYAGKPIANNTRARRSSVGAPIVIRYHATDILTFNPDGTVILDCAGWRSVTTAQRVKQLSNIQRFSECGEWFVLPRDHGAGPRPAYPEGHWSAEREDEWKAYRRAGDDWCGRAYIAFVDGMTFDSDGYVIDVPVARYGTTRPGLEGVARLADRRIAFRAEKNARARQARADKKRRAEEAQRRADEYARESAAVMESLTFTWPIGHTKDTHVLMFKRATEVMSGVFDSRHGGTYRIGQTTTAEDYTADPYCGHGLHFGTLEQVNGYWSDYGRSVLAVLVQRDGMIPLANKVKARSCYVLGKVS